jgi:isopropylmalate/homocitrate/citramalate synthase
LTSLRDVKGWRSRLRFVDRRAGKARARPQETVYVARGGEGTTIHFVIPNRVNIVEVGPRDGLQNEPAPIPTEIKLAFIRKLVEAGLTQIEATSFVHPDKVPQLADAAEVVAGLPESPGVVYSALVPNEKGLERAAACGVKRIAVFTAASETFAKKNIGMSIDESIEVFARVARQAARQGMSVRGYLSTSFECPYEGAVDPERVRDLTLRLLDIGVDQVAISDTIGAAAPNDVDNTVGTVMESVPRDRIALHFHDTNGTALANVYAGLLLGIETFDASAGGLGGCPFAPGAAGNLATEDLVYMLDRMGIATGVVLDGVVEAAGIVAGAMNRPLSSKQWVRARSAHSPRPGHRA